MEPEGQKNPQGRGKCGGDGGVPQRIEGASRPGAVTHPDEQPGLVLQGGAKTGTELDGPGQRLVGLGSKAAIERTAMEQLVPVLERGEEELGIAGRGVPQQIEPGGERRIRGANQDPVVRWKGVGRPGQPGQPFRVLFQGFPPGNVEQPVGTDEAGGVLLLGQAIPLSGVLPLGASP